MEGFGVTVPWFVAGTVDIVYIPPREGILAKETLADYRLFEQHRASSFTSLIGKVIHSLDKHPLIVCYKPNIQVILLLEL